MYIILVCIITGSAINIPLAPPPPRALKTCRKQIYYTKRDHVYNVTRLQTYIAAL